MILCICLFVSSVWETASSFHHDLNPLMELRRVVDFHLVQFVFFLVARMRVMTSKLHCY